ncbi:MAG: hypothetical protein LBS70_06425 [Candidatus Accumulibacter sp.]|jgi:hypothetical protein|nr:hypothetical protein [Accumulibacter sp.]
MNRWAKAGRLDRVFERLQQERIIPFSNCSCREDEPKTVPVHGEAKSTKARAIWKRNYGSSLQRRRNPAIDADLGYVPVVPPKKYRLDA